MGVKLKITLELVVNIRSLVYRGLIFGLVDYSIIIALNHLDIVVGDPDVKLLFLVMRENELITKAKIQKIEAINRL